MAVEHTVTIEHTFVSDSGAEVLVVIDQGNNSIVVRARAVKGGETLTLTRDDVHKLLELFSQVDEFLPAETLPAA